MRHILSIAFLLIAYSSFSQDSISCKDLRNGVFYGYFKNSDSRYVFHRDNKFQKEINLLTGDSTLWKIKWMNDCTYSLEFISTSEKISADQRELQSKHNFIFSITEVGKDYYTFKGSIDRSTNPVVLEDTMWFSEKLHPSNSELFKLLKSEKDIHRLRDTSKYAILYIYRPHKLSLGLADYLVYFDNVLMTAMPNNTGYAFKILKEGAFPVTSRLLGDVSTAKVEIKFGHVYYVKAAIKWTISKRLNNFKLETTQISNEKGEKEFEEIKNK